MTDSQDLTVWLSENNFVFSRTIKNDEAVKVMYTRYDLTVANPINTYLGSFNPLIDEMSAIEVFSNQTAIQAKKTTLTGNGTNIYAVTDKIIAETLMTTDAGIDVTTSPKVTSAANAEYRVTFKESFDVKYCNTCSNSTLSFITFS